MSIIKIDSVTVMIMIIITLETDPKINIKSTITIKIIEPNNEVEKSQIAKSKWYINHYSKASI